MKCRYSVLIWKSKIYLTILYTTISLSNIHAKSLSSLVNIPVVGPVVADSPDETLQNLLLDTDDSTTEVAASTAATEHNLAETNNFKIIRVSSVLTYLNFATNGSVENASGLQQQRPAAINLENRLDIEKPVFNVSVSELNNMDDYSNLENNANEDAALVKIRRGAVAHPTSEKTSGENLSATTTTQATNSEEEMGTMSSPISNSTFKSDMLAEPPSGTPLAEATNVSNFTTSVPETSTFLSESTEKVATTIKSDKVISTTTQNQSDPESKMSHPIPIPDESETKTVTDSEASLQQDQHVETTTAQLPPSPLSVKPENEQTLVSSIVGTNSTNDTTTTGESSTSEEKVPVIVFNDDPAWYGNPKKIILDDYTVFRLRGCADFSCKHDF